MKITPTFTRTGPFSERYFVWTFIIIVLLISLLDLTGWVFDIRQLKSVGEDWIPMKVITAVCFILSALSLIIIYKKKVPPVFSKLPVVFGIFVFVIGALSCSVHYMLLTTGNEPALAGYWFIELFLSPANRMAFLTAGNFEFIGIILVLFSFHRRKLSNLAHVLIIPVLVISYLIPISYILGVHSLHSVNNISVALNTGIAFLALCLAILFVRPDTFLMKVFTSLYAGGLMSRQMIPVLMLLPVIIGWFRIYGEKQGIYESEVGVVLVALTYTVCFVMLMWISARSVNFRDKNRRKAEEELKRSVQQNEFLGNIVQTSSQPFGVGYPDGKLGLINKAFEELTGYDSEELHAMDWAKQLTPPEWNETESQKLGELNSTGVPVRYEKEYIRKDGSRVPIELLVHIIKDTNETPLYYYSFLTDISERKLAENALRESEERYATTLSSIGDAVIATDIHGNITFLNPVAEYLTGWELIEARQKPVKEVFNIINEHSREEVESPIEKVLERGSIIGLANHTILLRKDGSEVPIDDSGAPIKDRNGNTFGVVLVFRDISERKQNEETLRVSREQLRAVFDGVAETVLLLDLKGNILAANRVANSRFVNGQDTLVGKNMFATIPASYHETRKKQIAELIRTKKPIKFQDSIGETQLEISFYPVFDKDGDVIQFISSALDITERKKAEEALAKMSTLLSESQKIAHLGSFEYIAATQTTVWSEEEFHIYGLDPAGPSLQYEEMLKNCIHPEDVQLLNDTFAAAMINKSVYELEHRIVLPDGSVRFVYDLAHPYFDSNGELLRYVGATLDITERKKAEEALKESENKLWSVLNATQETIYTFDRDGIITLTNHTGCQRLGKEHYHEVIGHHFSEFMSPELTKSRKAKMDLIFKTGKHMEFEDERNSMIFHHHFFPIFKFGEVTSLVTFSSDITQRKKAEKELLESEEKFAKVFETSPFAIALSEQSTGLLHDVNPAWEKIYGYKRNDVIGKTSKEIGMFIDEGERTKLLDAFQESVKIDSLEMNFRRSDGEHIITELAGGYIDLSEKKYIMSLSHDITGKKKIEDTLRFLLDARNSNTGENYFDALARYLADTLDMDFVCIDRLEGDLLSAETLAVFSDGKFDPNISYTLKDTPCGEVAGNQVCSFKQGVRNLFPKDQVLQDMKAESYVGVTLWNSAGKAIGLIAVIGRNPLADTNQPEMILKMVAGSAANELERSQTEEALKESQKRLTAALDAGELGSWGLDIKTKKAWRSLRHDQIFGYKELLPVWTYDMFLEHVLSEDRKNVDDKFGKALAEFTDWDFECRINRTDGEIRWIWAQGKPVIDDHNQVITLSGFVKDITDRKNIELVLQESENRFRTIAESIPVEIAISRSSDSTIIFNNSVYEKDFGYEPGEMLGQTTPNLYFDKNDRKILRQKLEKEGLLNDHILKVKKKDGSPFWISTSMRRIQFEGEPCLIVASVDITERLKAEEALKESEEKFATTLSSIGDAVISTDAAGNITFLNPIAEQLTGWTKEEAHQRPSHEVFHIVNEFSRMKVESPIDKVIQIGKIVEMSNHTILIKKDGAEVPIDDSGAPIRDKDGNIIGVVLVFRDITQRKITEENRSRLAAIIETSEDAIISKDLDDIITTWNHGAEVIFGYATEEILGKPIYTIIPPGYENEEQEITDRINKGVGVEHYETKRIRKDKTIISISVSVSPLFDFYGRMVGTSKIIRDISRQKMAEEALIKSRQEWIETFDMIPDLIAIIDNNHIIQRANKAMLNVLGVSDAAAVGQHCFMCVHDADKAPSFCPHSKMLLDGKQHITELFEERLGGDYLVSVTPIFDDDGNITGSVHVARDITERKIAEQELVRLNRTLQALGESSQAMMYSIEEKDYLNNVCRIIVEDCGHLMAWIGFAMEDKDRTVEPVASFGVDEGYTEKLDITWADTKKGRGPTGTAIRTAKPVVCRNMLTDPDFEPWRKEAVKRGFSSSVVIPLIDETKVIGALNIYSKDPDPFTQGEITLLSDIAADMVHGIKTLRLRQSEKIALDLLTASEEKFRAVATYTPDYITVQDIDLRYTLVINPLLGLTEKDMLGKTDFELMPSEDARPLVELKNKVLVTGYPEYLDAPAKVADGSVIYIDGVYVPNHDSKGTINGIIGYFKNITDNKLAEAALQESEKKLWSVLHATQESIYMFDRDGKFLIANQIGLKRLRKSNSNEILGHHFSEFMTIEQSAQRQEMIDEVLNKKKPVEFDDQRKDKVFHHNFFPVFTGDEISYIVAYSADITLRVNFENELREKNFELQDINATKDKFFSIIAHDMKNPFISLLGASEMLYENAGRYDKKRILDLAKILNDSAKSGYNMLLNLLEWARSQAGSMVFTPEQIILKELLDKNLTNLTELAIAKEIDLNFEVSPQIQLFADRNMLNTILRNLINNALKFTSRGGKIVVGSKLKDSQLVIFVKDSGVGIEKSDFDKLFRTDIKYSKQGTEHEIGTGLGLLLCKEFVEKHGGKIWVESSVGKGSVFYFTIPRDAERLEHKQALETDHKKQKTRSQLLRLKAERLFNQKLIQPGAKLSEAESLKLIHELEVHQIELEMQNEELMVAKLKTELAEEKFIDLFDFAPSGYVTLSKDAEILDANHHAALMLGKERHQLKNNRFGFFITDDTKPIFHQFFENVFNDKVKKNCEVMLSTGKNQPRHVYLAGILTQNEKTCLINMVDLKVKARDGNGKGKG